MGILSRIFGGSDDDQAQPKDAGLSYEDTHPKTMETSELDAVNEGMVERHHKARRIVDGHEWPSWDEIEQDGDHSKTGANWLLAPVLEWSPCKRHLACALCTLEPCLSERRATSDASPPHVPIF